MSFSSVRVGSCVAADAFTSRLYGSRRTSSEVVLMAYAPPRGQKRGKFSAVAVKFTTFLTTCIFWCAKEFLNVVVQGQGSQTIFQIGVRVMS